MSETTKAEFAAIEAQQDAYWQARNTDTPSHCASCRQPIGPHRAFSQPHLCATCAVYARFDNVVLPATLDGVAIPGTDLIGDLLAREAAAGDSCPTCAKIGGLCRGCEGALSATADYYEAEAAAA